MKYKAEIIVLAYIVIVGLLMLFINNFIREIPFLSTLFLGMLFGIMGDFLYTVYKEDK